MHSNWTHDDNQELSLLAIQAMVDRYVSDDDEDDDDDNNTHCHRHYNHYY